ncbi:MAG: glycosyltransferase, partial [Candidatus Cloacimonadaceae bacterium]
DKQIGWVPFAFIKAIRVIRKYRIRNIYITASPFSAFICGIMLKNLFGSRIFWVADYRDAWQFAPLIKKFVLPFRYKIICDMDKKVLYKADYVTFSAPDVLNCYQQKYSWLKGKSDYITNGYDEDDYIGLRPQKFDILTFVYMGKLHPVKGNPLPLLRELKNLSGIDIQYLHLGIISQKLRQKIEQEGMTFFRFIGYKSHTEALSYSAGADINVLILNNDPDSRGVIPGKLFELIRLGKPILAVGPESSTVREIITDTASGIYVCNDDPEQIRAAIKQLISGKFQLQQNLKLIEQYSRKVCTEKLEAIYLRRAKESHKISI